MKLLAPWSLVVRSSLAVSIASCHHPNQLLFGFGEIVINHNTYGVTNHLSFLRNDIEVLRSTKKNAPVSDNIIASKLTPHKATRAALSETGSHVNDLNICQGPTSEFALISFL